MSIVYPAKANDDFISFCECDSGLVGGPGQMDCPWCGCGWLFTCIKCRKAFSFAQAVEIDKTWEELAREDASGFGGPEPDEEYIAGWIGAMQEMTAHIEAGQIYVYLDGFYIPIDEENFGFEGWHTQHQFTKVPQIMALQDDTIVENVLSNQAYWTENAIEAEA